MPKTTRPTRMQRRIPGVRRTPMGTAVSAAIERAVAREMRRYGVSRSFVIANALMFTFGIEEDSYRADGVRRRAA